MVCLWGKESSLAGLKAVMRVGRLELKIQTVHQLKVMMVRLITMVIDWVDLMEMC